MTSDGWSDFDRVCSAFRHRDWKFEIRRDMVMHSPPVLRISFRTDDSLHPAEEQRLFAHMFQLPSEGILRDPPWDDLAVTQWFFDRVCDVLRHEAMENVEVDGVKLFYPQHAWGDAYTRTHVSVHPMVRYLREVGRGD